MKKKMSNKQLIALNSPFIVVIIAIMVALVVLSYVFANTISLFLYGNANVNVDQTVLNEGAELCEDIVDEGTVLLKNENNALPLTKAEISKVNVFGWAAYDWMTSTYGSGFSNTSLTKMKLFPALDEAKIEYNTTLYNMYKNFYSSNVTEWGMTLNEYRGDIKVGTPTKFILHEPGAAYYTNEIIEEAKAFSSVALVVIGRTGAEGADLRLYQTKQIQTNQSPNTIVDNNRIYLELSTEEEAMIAAAKNACSKVIVVLNTSNTMETGFIDDSGIDAALLVGLTGLTGVNSVIDILRGKNDKGDPVTPSGRTTDTYAYDIFSAPSSVNSGYEHSALKYTGLPTSNSYNKGYYDAYIDYHEGIYVGYRYYETAAEMKSIDYDSTVQYPFGYGLSYATFNWSVSEINIGNTEQNYAVTPVLKSGDEIKIKVKVTNTHSTYSGKDVVQLYYTPQYISGGIEKSHVVLGDFAKTPLLGPGESCTVTLSLTVRSMASYDCYDKNGNGHTGYELDGGDYYLRLMTDSHEAKVLAAGSKTESVIKYNIPQGGYNYDTDDKTGKKVENRFTGENTIDGHPIDGSKEDGTIKYMTRADFKGTFPTSKVIRGRNADAYAIASAIAPTAAQLKATGYSDTAMPVTSSGGSYKINDFQEIDDYDDPLWNVLIKQISTAELFQLIRNGFFKTAAIASIGKPEFVDLDGPAGLNNRVTSSVSCTFVAYPSATMLAQTWNTDLAYAMGISVGKEARSDETSSIRGWYAPGANIHRNPLGGRNAEYYSEDPLLSGKFCSETVAGANNQGLYCYLKHFAVNETESLREGLYTFLTEQTLREIYLKPFEMSVKEGGGNALMTSMNRIGPTWVGASRALCTDVLRTEWGFKGSIVTDWVDSGKSDYMPAYKGIWAGNDIWLNNADSQKMFNDSQYTNDAVFVSFAQDVAHHVLWTLVDTEQTAAAFDPTAPRKGLGDGGFTYNYSWVIYIVIIEVVLAGGAGVIIFFLVKKIRRNMRLKVSEQNNS